MKGDIEMANYGDIYFELIDEIGVLHTETDGWSMELNVVKWNNGVAKYDIRKWNEDKSRMSKGLTLTEEELQGLHKLLLEKYGTKPLV